LNRNTDEEILCVENVGPGYLGITRGEADPVYSALDSLKIKKWRQDVETNDDMPLEQRHKYKQVVTYVIVEFATATVRRVLAYERLKGGTDNRLHNAMSIGFGGHVNWLEGETAGQMITASLLAELEEELDLTVDLKRLDFIGEVYTDIDPIGQDHLGLLYIYSVPDESYLTTLRTLEPKKIRLFWTDPSYLEIIEPRLENWSKAAALYYLNHELR
jgi:predicted NUDIX family phosphoesterase